MSNLKQLKFWLKFSQLRTGKKIDDLLIKQYGEYTTGRIWGDLARHHYLYYQRVNGNIFNSHRKHAKIRIVKKEIRKLIKQYQHAKL